MCLSPCSCVQVRVNRPRTDIVQNYLQVGKAIGDKRAIIAERGYNRPFQKIFISGGGVLS
jgi:peptidyl-prolyl cis-trans isomerase B (cyclophilin B)